MHFMKLCLLASTATAMVMKRATPAAPSITITDFYVRHIPGEAYESLHFHISSTDACVPTTLCKATFACRGTKLCAITSPDKGTCYFKNGHIEFYLEEYENYPLGKWALNVQTYSPAGHYGFSRSIADEYDVFVEEPMGSGVTYEALRVPGRTFTMAGSLQPALLE